MQSPVVYVFLNKNLGMSVGKASAQAVHAALMIALDTKKSHAWKSAPHRTVIILEARDESHLKNIQDYLNERDIRTERIIDEGVNEIDPIVWTALATEILDKDDLDVQKALSSFSLYKDRVRVVMEMDI